MVKVKLVIEYNGKGFHGWQQQGESRTIQSELTKAIRMILRCETSPIEASGRTDAGVHARGQVVTFKVAQEIDLRRLSYAISNVFRGELSVISAVFVDRMFHPRRSAVCKQYTYSIMNRAVPPVLERGFVWHVAVPLDEARMHHLAQELVGTHDFSGLRAGDCNSVTPVKTLYELEVTRDARHIISIRVIGSGFLKQMVRNIVGTLVDLERGRLPHFSSMSDVLAAKDRKLSGVTAPAYGLCLDWVSYDKPVQADV